MSKFLSKWGEYYIPFCKGFNGPTVKWNKQDEIDKTIGMIHNLVQLKTKHVSGNLREDKEINDRINNINTFEMKTKYINSLPRRFAKLDSQEIFCAPAYKLYSENGASISELFHWYCGIFMKRSLFWSAAISYVGLFEPNLSIALALSISFFDSKSRINDASKECKLIGEIRDELRNEIQSEIYVCEKYGNFSPTHNTPN